MAAAIMFEKANRAGPVRFTRPGRDDRPHPQTFRRTGPIRPDMPHHGDIALGGLNPIPFVSQLAARVAATGEIA